MSYVNSITRLVEAGNLAQFEAALSSQLQKVPDYDQRKLFDECAAAAIRHHQQEILSHILSLPLSAEATARKPYNKTYFAAAEAGDPASIDQLLAAGFKLKHETLERLGNWLGAVVSYGNLPMLKHVFALSPPQPQLTLRDITVDPGYCPLTGVSDGRGDAVGTLRFLLARGAKVKGSFALHAAASSGTVSIMEVLVDEAGADVNEVPPDSALSERQRFYWSRRESDLNGAPLHWAASARKMESLRWLLDRGADPSIKDPRGRTVLQRSEWLGKPPNPVWADLVEEFNRRGIQSGTNSVGEHLESSEKLFKI